MARPLEGVLVLELCQALAGPYCCQLLADLGARVIKVEKPGGDDSRRMPPHFLGDTSLYFMSPNRGKESLVLDLKTPAGRDVALKLAAKADIIVENNRPGVLDRLGLGFEALKAVNPDVVLCSISGFGQDGPYRDMAAYDPIVQAMSGVMSLTGEPGGRPVRAGVPIGDLCAAMDAALGAVAALRQAQATGEGRHLDVSMLDVQVSMMSYHMIYYLHSGVVPGVQGQRHTGVPEQGEYVCADGVTIFVAPMAETMWLGLCRALERPDWLAEPRYTTRISRMNHVEPLRAELEALYRTRPSDVWVERLRREGVPAAPINTLDRVAADPQVQSRGLIAETTYDGAPVRLVGSPLRFAGEGPAPPMSPPALGAHTRKILTNDLEMTEAEIARLMDVGETPPARY